LPVAPGQAVDEAATRVLAQLAVASVIDVVNAFVFFVIAEVTGGDKPGVFKQICPGVCTGSARATTALRGVIGSVTV